MQKKKRHEYTDGVAYFCKKKTEKNPRSMDDLEIMYKLAYEEKSIRQADMEFAVQMDKQMTLKIVTQDNGVMDSTLLTAVNNALYAIIHIDRDRKANELYFYLQEVRRLD